MNIARSAILFPCALRGFACANALLAALARRWQNPPQISDQQETAIELMLTGKKQKEIAETLGVHRGTLYRWRRQDPDFRRALAIAREKAFRDATDQLRELVPKALEIMQAQLNEENYQAAVRVLRLVRIDRHEPTATFPALATKLRGAGRR